MKICTFFGHSDCPESVKFSLMHAVENLILQCNVTDFLVGDKGKFDRLVRSVLQEMEAKYPHISYAVVLSRLPEKVSEYEDYSHTVFPEGIEKSPPRFAISWRNRWMLKRSDYVVAYVCHS